jgi:hypothetical protein
VEQSTISVVKSVSAPSGQTLNTIFTRTNRAELVLKRDEQKLLAGMVVFKVLWDR